MKPMRENKSRILLAVDGSNHSMEAVRYAGALFPPERTVITLYHVFSRVPEFFYDLGKDPLFHRSIINTRGWGGSAEK
jgi:hypothetical protein